VFAEPINTLVFSWALLYADDAYFASTPKSILQKSMDILTEVFDRVGLRTNTEKTKVMTCVNEKVHVRRSEEVYLTYAAMQSPSGAWDCPVPDCPGSVQMPWNLRRHFCDRHPLDLSKLCREGAERKAQYAAAAANAHALEVEFTAYGETLERVEVFKYLGRLMAMDGNDMHAVRHNLKKARGVWKRFSVLFHRENLPPRVCGMFYKAVIQSVLLYGSETWSLSDSSMSRLEGFHFLAACRMARVNRPRRVQRDVSVVVPIEG
ncbi:hypothetical protein THAOC_10191, partial [Thalassiosira oceanica]